MKPKKDRMFIIILAITAANLGRELLLLAIRLTSGQWIDPQIWLFLIANIIAFTGILWLIRTSKRSRKLEKELQENQEAEENSRERV